VVKQGAQAPGVTQLGAHQTCQITEFGDVISGAGDMPVGVNEPVGSRAIFHVRTRQLTPQVF